MNRKFKLILMKIKLKKIKKIQNMMCREVKMQNSIKMIAFNLRNP